VGAIKTGLENDGLGDLVKEIRMNDTPGNTRAARLINRRDRFVDARIYLPQVLWVNGESPRPLDYEEDVLFSIDWDALDVSPLVAKIPVNAQAPEHQMRRIRLAEQGQALI